jgi:hypothetical protein
MKSPRFVCGTPESEAVERRLGGVVDSGASADLQLVADGHELAIVSTDTRGPPGAWATRLWRLDTRATARLTLSPAHSPKCWLLEQANRPLGVIERAAGGDRFRTTSEAWHAEMRRRRRHLAWHIEFTRADEAHPALVYAPRTSLPGGRFALADGHSYRLRCPLLRADWSIAARPTGQIARIALSLRARAPDSMKYVRFGDPGRRGTAVAGGCARRGRGDSCPRRRAPGRKWRCVVN